MYTSHIVKGLAAAALVGGVICSTSTDVFAREVLPSSFASRAERCAVGKHDDPQVAAHDARHERSGTNTTKNT